jgi:HlyD family secretion protein
MKQIILVLVFLLTGCQFQDTAVRYDGRVEATEIRVSAQTPGTLGKLLVDEGDYVKNKQPIVMVNKDRLQAQYEQVVADLRFAQATLRKYQQLITEGAISQQQYDELAARVDVLRAQAKNIKIQLKDAAIVSPLTGTILTVYAREGEYVQPGSPILDLADLSVMEVRVYVPLSKLPAVKIGQLASVYVDGLNKILSGKVSWIASEAEFTPKTILTPETRTTLVYAVKVRIPNQAGILKIGMPVDVRW